MVVCTLCGGLRGRSVRDPGLVQGCHCMPEAFAGDWDQFDFHRDLELCGLCAGIVIQSGSRWSRLVCGKCLPLAREANNTAGFTMVPVGRHSLVNGITLTTATGSPGNPTGFVNGLGGVRAALEDQRAWRRRLVRERVGGHVDEVGLRSYLTVAESQGFDRPGLLDRFQQHRREAPLARDV